MRLAVREVSGSCYGHAVNCGACSVLGSGVPEQESVIILPR
jgi:hypothetical protein